MRDVTPKSISSHDTPGSASSGGKRPGVEQQRHISFLALVKCTFLALQIDQIWTSRP